MLRGDGNEIIPRGGGSMKAKQGVAPRTSDEAVKAKTGRMWAEWFKMLDAAGEAKHVLSRTARQKLQRS